MPPGAITCFNKYKKVHPLCSMSTGVIFHFRQIIYHYYLLLVHIYIYAIRLPLDLWCTTIHIVSIHWYFSFESRRIYGAIKRYGTVYSARSDTQKKINYCISCNVTIKFVTNWGYLDNTFQIRKYVIGIDCQQSYISNPLFSKVLPARCWMPRFCCLPHCTLCSSAYFLRT